MGGALFNSTHVAGRINKNPKKNSRTDTKKKTVIETEIENFQSIFFSPKSFSWGSPMASGSRWLPWIAAPRVSLLSGAFAHVTTIPSFYVSCHLSSTLSRDRPNIIHQNVFSWRFWDTLNWHIQCSSYFKVHSLKKPFEVRWKHQMWFYNLCVIFFLTLYIIVLLRINNYYH